MDIIKIIWLGCVVVLLGVMGGLVIDRINSSSGYSFYISNDKIGEHIDPKCQMIKIEINDSLTEPYLIKGEIFSINPKLCANLSMPKKFKSWYNLSQSPISYYFNDSKENIVVIGDSYSAGAGVQKNETFPYLLNQMGKYNIINLGISGLNTKQEILRLKEIGLAYDPKFVILQFYDNDWEDGEVLWSFIRNISSYLEEKNLSCLTDPLTQDNKLFTDLYQLIYMKILSKDMSYYIEKNIVSPMKEFNDLSNKYNFTVIILKLPSNQEWVGKIFGEELNDNRWKIIKLEEEMNFHGWKPPFTISPYNSHFSLKTHIEVAHIIMKYLK